MATEDSAKLALLDQLAEDFAARYRRGERPALQEYLDRFPELADDIRLYFPALAEMENVKEARQEAEEQPGPTSPLEQLGDYRIIRKVGQGGMGVVYEAEQVSLGRRVALKVLPQKTKMLLDPVYKRRFEREAKSAARLHHTNIVPVFGVGVHDGIPYYAMQFIQGLGLDEVLEELKQMQSGAGAAAMVPAASARTASRTDLSAAGVARSLVSGEFQGATPANHDDSAKSSLAATVDHPPSTLKGQTASGGAANGRLSDSFSFSGSSIVLPGQSETSGRKTKKQTYWQSVAKIGIQVADALQYAHKQGVLHRDIKPSNLLLDLRGTVWVTDFGLAKADDHQDLTQTGEILGTLRYMPPEAFEGRTDARSDIYALGLTLFELLALRPAFVDRDRAQLIKRVTSEEPVRLDHLKRDVPRDLVTIVHKAIDRDPDHRYPTAGDLGADLQRYLDDEPIQARRTSALERVWRWCKRKPAVASLAAAVVFLLMVAALGGITAAVHFGKLAEHEAMLKADAAHARDQAQELAETSRQRLVRLNVLKGTRLLDDGDVPGSLVWFTEALRLDQGDPAREELHRQRIASAWSQCPKPVHVWFHEGASRAIFSPDGRLVLTQTGLNEFADGQAVPADARNVRIREATTGKAVSGPLSHGDLVSLARFSADSQRVLTVSLTQLPSDTQRPYYGQPELVVWDALTGKPLLPAVKLPDAGWVTTALVDPACSRCLVVAANAKTNDPAMLLLDRQRELFMVDMASGKVLWKRIAGTTVPVLSPDGQRVLLAGPNLQILDCETGQNAVILRGSGSVAISARFSPDGNWVVLTSSKAGIWNARTGERQPFELTHPNITVKDAVFSPDGKRVVTCGWYSLRVWETASGKPLTDYMVHGSDVASVQFTPDGRRIIAGGNDGIVSLWDAEKGTAIAAPLCHGGSILHVRVSPDGRRISTASTDGAIRVWDLATGVMPSRTGMGTEDSTSQTFAFSPDGRYLGIAGATRKARVWNLGDGRPITESLAHDGTVTAVFFSPDGRQLATTCDDRKVRVWEVGTSRLLFSTEAHTDSLDRVVYSPDGKLLATLAWRQGTKKAVDCEVRIWDALAGKPLTGVLKHSAIMAFAAGFTGDSRHLVTVDRHETKVWNARTGDLVSKVQFPTTYFTSVCMSPDGTRIAAASFGRGLVWEGATGKKIADLRLGGEVFELAFSSDGRFVLSATGDGIVQAWEATSGDPIGPPLQHKGLVHAAFSADGRRIVTCTDRAARLWETGTGAPVTGPLKDSPALGFALLSWDARHLATRSGRRQPLGQVRVWDLPLDPRPVADLINRVHFLAARRISSSESFVPLTSAEVQKTWSDVLAQQGVEFKATSDQELAWHQEEATDCEQSGNYQAALPHLTRLLKLNPARLPTRERRGNAYAELQLWEQATADYAEIADALIDDQNVRMGYNLLCIRAGDRAAYRAWCAKVLVQAANAKDHDAANVGAWTCAMAPDTVDDFQAVVKLAERAVAGAPAATLLYYLNTLGAALCRNGQHQEALIQLRESVRLRGQGGVPIDWLFMAMAHHRLGQHEEARPLLDKSIAWIDAALQKPPLALGSPVPAASRYEAKLLTWNERLELQLLRKEVETLVAGKAK